MDHVGTIGGRVLVQIGDGEPIEVGTIVIPIHGNAEPAECPDHRLVQHRDNKPPWCNTCRRTANE